MKYTKLFYIATLFTVISQVNAMEEEIKKEIEYPMSGEDTNEIFVNYYNNLPDYNNLPGSVEETNFPSRRTGNNNITEQSSLQYGRRPIVEEPAKKSFFRRNK